ncbi:conserved hypothetical protein [Beutenbergia cavernae DSM 12333]|uniref:Uncharacterized protein n=1 Tax=Beutenbergia cavernae (strain ATCC BAA-8 / DSM 12333 / CCUG 43141 / JCM 11478 / NBRC 16432 / NCIMB 13614 / HKI 0122) TaxID=471853 RepID=C5C3F9_BEUC1|nr:DUF6297 family protein [Beutenbergia cavernae]ACQ79858.1 conserved hypothetical protein [Beutenbergia cavernae DSM 12333]
MKGREVRALTAQVARARSGAGIGTILGDVYIAVFSAAIAVAMAASIAGQLGTGLRAPEGAGTLDPGWLAPLIALAGFGGLLAVTARLGPLGVGTAGAVWWLPMPVDRRSLLRPAAGRWLVAGLLVGAVAAGIVLALVAAAVPTGAVLALTLAAAACVGALVVAATGLTQTMDITASRRRAVHLAFAGDLALLLAPVAGLVLSVTRPEPPDAAGLASGSVLVGVVAILAAGVVVAAVVLDARLERVRGADLRERGARAAYASGAAVSMDTRELGRAMSEASEPDARRRPLSFGWVTGPVSALASADLLVLLRSPRHVVQLVATACLPIAAVLSGLSALWLTAACLVGAGYVAALASAEGARRAEMAPVLDRTFGIDATTTRRTRLIVPVGVLLVWTVPVFAVIGAHAGDAAGWVALGIVAAPVWGAGAVRAAYRRPPDWSGPLVMTPGGALPPGVAGAIAKGPDITILGLIPTLIAFLTGVVSPTLVFAQLAVTAIMCAIAAHVPAKHPRSGSTSA